MSLHTIEVRYRDHQTAIRLTDLDPEDAQETLKKLSDPAEHAVTVTANVGVSGPSTVVLYTRYLLVVSVSPPIPSL